MKKNWMLRLGLLAMVLTLVTMPMVSSTYAKYVTSANASDTARVAKWGVTVAVTGGAFATSYATDDGAVSGTIANSVVSSTVNKKVAPGTTGTFTGVAITGTPEVAVNVAVTPVLTLTGWTLADGQFYCPIVITVNGAAIKGYEYTTASAFKTAVENAIQSAEGNYAANTNLGTISNLSGNYTWAWAFETTDSVDSTYSTGTSVAAYFVNTGSGTGAAATGTFVSGTTYYNTLVNAQTNDGFTGKVDTTAFVEHYTYDMADTYLGNLATLPLISLEVTATVTQIN